MNTHRLHLPISREGILSFVQEFSMATGLAVGATVAADRFMNPTLSHTGNMASDFMSGPGGGYMIAFAGACLIPIVANCIDITTRKNNPDEPHDFFCGHHHDGGKILGAVAGLVLGGVFLSTSIGAPFTRSGPHYSELTEKVSSSMAVTAEKFVAGVTQPLTDAYASPYTISYGSAVAYVPKIHENSGQNRPEIIIR